MKQFDMKGEENFGRITSLLYANFSALFSGPAMYNFAANDILKSKSKKVLDVGTGPGAIPILLSSRSQKLDIYAIDPSKYMLSIASKRASGRNIHFASGYSLHVPFHTKFDMIISSISFHHWAHKKESLVYLSKFLNKEGEIRIYEFKKIKHLIIQEQHSMTRDELREAILGTGMHLKEIIEEKGKLRASYVKA